MQNRMLEIRDKFFLKTYYIEIWNLQYFVTGKKYFISKSRKINACNILGSLNVIWSFYIISTKICC